MPKNMSKKKDEINPLVLAVIGIVVAGASLAINLTQDSNFVVFMIIGLIMFSYGIVKHIILGHASGERSGQSDRGDTKRSSPSEKTPNAVHNHRSHGTNVNNSRQSSINYCPRCGLRMTVHPNFCPNCGLKLK